MSTPRPDRSEAAAATYRVDAYNTATASTNKIHDDKVARTLGFRGGLVPGVDVYAYLCHLPVARWGRAWLEGGTINARFASPVYDGDTVEITASESDPMTLELRDPTGSVCATATAGMADDDAPPVPDAWPVGPLPEEPPAASAETISAATLGALTVNFHADHAGEYLDAIREQLPLFRTGGLAHPGWLLRYANYVLSNNVRLGPWIHVSSDVRFYGVANDGDCVETRAHVTRVWERRGHEFVELDVLQLAGGRLLARTAHTAIFRPRGL